MIYGGAPSLHMVHLAAILRKCVAGTMGHHNPGECVGVRVFGLVTLYVHVCFFSWRVHSAGVGERESERRTKAKTRKQHKKSYQHSYLKKNRKNTYPHHCAPHMNKSNQNSGAPWCPQHICAKLQPGAPCAETARAHNTC